MSAQRGFTLIELLVVISIIAILSVVGVVVYSGIQKSAKGATRRADIEAISKAYETNFDGSKYQVLTKDNFAGGTIPTPYPGGSYFMYGPNTTGAKTDGFAICASLVDDNSCSMSSGDCFCLQSSQGSAQIDLLSQAPNVVYSESFENDSDGDGLADGWIQTWVNSPHPPASTVRYSRVSPGFDKNYSQKVTNAQFGEALYSPSITLQPNTKYTYSAWVKLTELKGSTGGVDIRVALNSGGCGVVGSPRLSQLNQYTKLSVTFTTCDAPTVGAIITIQPIESGRDPGNLTSYEADALQIVKQ